MSELTEEETYIVLQSLKALHQLKYISDIALALQDNTKVLQALVEEVVLIREKMYDEQ